MSQLKVNTIRHTGGSADNITLDNSQNVTVEGTATIDGNFRVGEDVNNDTATQGVALGTNGFIRSRVADTSADALIVGIENDGGSKVIINGAGNGYFADGVNIGGTGSANKMDDYEEGTWTPDIQFGGAKVGVGYNTNTGLYTKSGRLVFIRMYFHLSSRGSSAGAVRIYGLPFTSLGSSGYTPISHWYTNFGGLASPYNVYSYVESAATYVAMNKQSSGNTTNLAEDDLSNNCEIMLGGCYLTS